MRIPGRYPTGRTAPGTAHDDAIFSPPTFHSSHKITLRESACENRRARAGIAGNRCKHRRQIVHWPRTATLGTDVSAPHRRGRIHHTLLDVKFQALQGTERRALRGAALRVVAPSSCVCSEDPSRILVLVVVDWTH